MNETASIPAAVMLYFGALMVPAVYLLRRGVKERRGLGMLIGAATQLALYGVVFTGLAISRSHGGEPEGYAGPFYCSVINFLSFVYYMMVLLIGRVAHEKS